MARNVQNIKPVQFCTGFIFCTFPAVMIVVYNFHMHFNKLIFSNLLSADS